MTSRTVLQLVLALAFSTASVPAHAGLTWRASVATDGSEYALPGMGRLSADGRSVIFWAGLPTPQLFVHDRDTGATELLGTFPTREIAAISADGRFVAVGQSGPPIALIDRQLGTTTPVGPPNAVAPDISADGRYVAFSSAHGGFVYDRDTDTEERVDVAPGGGPFSFFSVANNLAISGDGNVVAFVEQIPGQPLAVYARDRTTGVTTLESVTPAGLPSSGAVDPTPPSLSYDGRFISFGSRASDLVAGDPFHGGVFVRDRLLMKTERASVGPTGAPADGLARAMSADGRFVGMIAHGPGLGVDIGGGFFHVYVRDRLLGTTTRVSVSSAQYSANFDAVFPISISADGRYTLFHSRASNLVVGDENNDYDVFVHDRDGALTCGDGVVQPGEECDDGNAISGDGCEPGCLIPDCFAGATVVGPTLKIAGIGAPPGDERLAFRGNLVFPPGVPAGFDPQANGAQVLIEDVGAGQKRILDVSFRQTPIAGDPCPTCSTDVWRVNHARTAFRYLTKFFAGPPTWNGLQVVSFTDRRVTKGTIAAKVTTKNSRLGTPVGPMRVTITPSHFHTAGLTGGCGAVTLPCQLRGTRMICG